MKKFQIKNGPALATASLLLGVALAVGGTVVATSIGTDVSVTGTLGVTGATTLSSTLDVTSATTLSNTLGVTGLSTLTGGAKVGANGTELTQVQSGVVHCGPIVGSQSITSTSTGVIGCWDGLSNVASGDKVFLTATTTALGTGGGSVVFTGKASTTATNFVQAELMNLTGDDWTVTTSSWYYLLVR